MPHRNVHLIIGIAGLLAVGALLLVRANVQRHSRSGWRVKQRLVRAGLLLLATFGLTAGPARDGGAQGRPQTPAKGQRQGLRERIAAVTRDAQAVTAGQRGQYPFDKAGKQRLLERLARAGDDVGALQREGEISAGEAGLWKQDLEQLAARVREYRPAEMRSATCYEPMPLPIPAQSSLTRLQARLPFLQQLASAGRLDPEVTRKVLRQIEEDLAVLQRDGELVRLTDATQRKRASVLARDVARQLERVRAKLGAGAAEPAPANDGKRSQLRQTPQWHALEAAMKQIAPLAKSSTTAQRTAADSKLIAALDGLAALQRRQLLSETEVSLLRAEGKRLREAMFRDPPKDFNGRCYRRAAFVPARDSLERLRRRLPLLRRLAAQGKLSPAVADKIIPVLMRDLAQLGERSRLRPSEQLQANRAAAEAEDLLAQLKRRVAR